MPPATPPRRSSSTHLTRDQRIRVRTLRDVGFTYEAIARHLDVTVRQAQHTCQAEQATPKKRSGRPPALTEAQTDELVNYIQQSKETRRKSYLRLAKEVFPEWNVGEYAIRFALRKRGFKRYIALAKPPLSEANQRKRLAWAEEHVNWSKDQWCQILWSDETWVNSTQHRKVWVTRQRGEELDNTCLVIKRRRAKGWMFWGSFNGTRKGPHLFWEKDWGTIGSESYRAHIVPLVEGWMRMYPGLIFMQDNAPGHAAADTIQDLQERGIHKEEWPPYSPDLNPIETVWNWMKDYLQRHYGHLEFGYNRLREVVNEAWDQITESQLEELINSMEERCKDVIKAEGGHTKW